MRASVPRFGLASSTPSSDVSVLVADEYPNFSICGIPYHVSGEVPDWRNLAHRTAADLEATGMRLHLRTVAERIDVPAHEVQVVDSRGSLALSDTTRSSSAPVLSRCALGSRDSTVLGIRTGFMCVHSMGDTFSVMETLTERGARSAVIIGAGYLGLEMAEALIVRGLEVTQVEQLPEVLPTVDPELGAAIAAELRVHGVNVVTGTAVQRITRADPGTGPRLRVEGASSDGTPFRCDADIILIFVGVRPDVDLAATAGATLGVGGAIAVDRTMRTNLPDVFAAGDCAVTHHRLLGESYIPLGTTAHKQGRIAGENAVGGKREFAGSLGTQVVKVFDMAVARTGLRDREAANAGFDPVTIAVEADDHKAYYPGSHRIAMRWTGDRKSGRLLGVQLYGHRHAEVAKRIDIAAAAIFNEMTVDAVSDLDLSYTPPLGSPWDAVQLGAQAWVRSLPT